MCARSERPVGSEIIEGVSLQLGNQQGRGYVRVVKRVMYGHVKDEELGNSLMLATSAVVGRLSAVQLVSSRHS